MWKTQRQELDYKTVKSKYYGDKMIYRGELNLKGSENAL
jgi:hypothetical protein